MALPVYKFLLGRQVRHHSIIHGGSRDHYMTDLKPYGLKAEHLSRTIGGSFDNSSQFDAIAHGVRIIII